MMNLLIFFDSSRDGFGFPAYELQKEPDEKTQMHVTVLYVLLSVFLRKNQILKKGSRYAKWLNNSVGIWLMKNKFKNWKTLFLLLCIQAWRKENYGNGDQHHWQNYSKSHVQQDGLSKFQTGKSQSNQIIQAQLKSTTNPWLSSLSIFLKWCRSTKPLSRVLASERISGCAYLQNSSKEDNVLKLMAVFLGCVFFFGRYTISSERKLEKLSGMRFSLLNVYTQVNCYTGSGR